MKCHICDKIFQNKFSHKRHLLDTHSEKKIHVCQFCGKGFKTKGNCKEHENNVHGSGVRKTSARVECDQCGKVLASNSLKDHKETHQADRKRYSCPLCQKTFLGTKALDNHIKVVHEKCKPYTCDFCGKSFPAKRSRDQHKQLVHEKDLIEKDFLCSKCGKAFYSESKLKRHLEEGNECRDVASPNVQADGQFLEAEQESVITILIEHSQL